MMKEMDEKDIGLSVARTKEFKAKISFCIHKLSPQPQPQPQQTVNNLQQGQSSGTAATGASEEEGGQGAGINNEHSAATGFGEKEEVVQRLLKIRDVLGSLENQYSALQELLHSQRHQRESAWAEIEFNKKKLLKKLKKYRGKDFQVIYETASFFSERAEVSQEILLPIHLPSQPNVAQNEANVAQNEIILSTVKSEEEKNQSDCDSKKSIKGFRSFINAAAKTMLMVVGLVSVLQLTGFEPRLRLRRRKERGNESKIVHECPPGKVLLVDLENGEMHCIVKEGVEVPFESVVVAKPDASFGRG